MFFILKNSILFIKNSNKSLVIYIYKKNFFLSVNRNIIRKKIYINCIILEYKNFIFNINLLNYSFNKEYEFLIL
jgi:hypothetical protein